LAEEIVGDARAGFGVVGPDDNRRGTVAHHHEIHQLA